MLTILRTQPHESAIATFLDAAVSLRDAKNNNIPGYPDILFDMYTYQKISKDKSENNGDQILLPINLFFATLSLEDQKEIYDMYKYAKEKIPHTNVDNKREIQDLLQEKIFNTVHGLKLPEKLIKFCAGPDFIYPDLSQVGKAAHHTPEMTFLEDDYIEITAISLLSKMMVPVWGEFIMQLSNIEISNSQRENLAFDLIAPTLEEGPFERIYNKLCFKLTSVVRDIRVSTDKKTMGGTTVSFILTHNGIDDQLFEAIIMATIVVKRMATYECFTRLRDGNNPNAMVYIDDGIKKTADTRIQALRKTMNTMPRKEQSNHDGEDNSSVIDYASRTSKMPIDVPIFVTTAVSQWELPRLIEDTGAPIGVVDAASEFYATNSFDISPLCQALMASFVGTRFGGSKCIGYLPLNTYQRLVATLQVFLINNGFLDLALLITSKTSQNPLEGGNNAINSRINANLKSKEYLRCQTIFKQYLDKPVIPFGKSVQAKDTDIEKIDFVNHINRLVEWLVKYEHSENTAPALWDFSKIENRPMIGSDCKFDENIVRDICRFYLMFHGGEKPF